MDDFIWIFVWCFIWAHIVDIAQMMGFALVLLIFALMCLAQLGKLYDWIKQECDLERLLDTPQKREDTKLEGTTFDFPEPEDEGPLTQICPFCGALYPSFKVRCNYDKRELQPFKKPITEPLPTLTVSLTVADDTAQMRKLAEGLDNELDRVRTELEEKAYQYNKRRPYTFTYEETRRLYNLYNEVRKQSHEEKAS